MSLTHLRKSLQTCCSVFTCCHTVHLACVPQTGPEREWFTEEMLKNDNGLQISIAVGVQRIIAVTPSKCYVIVYFFSLTLIFSACTVTTVERHASIQQTIGQF